MEPEDRGGAEEGDDEEEGDEEEEVGEGGREEEGEEEVRAPHVTLLNEERDPSCYFSGTGPPELPKVPRPNSR